MSKNINWNLFYKYVTGICTEKEQNEINKLLATDPSHKTALDDVKKIWETSDFLGMDHVDDHIDLEKEWVTMQRKMHAPESPKILKLQKLHRSYERSRAKRSRQIIWQVTRVAALIALTIGAAYLMSQFFYTNQTDVAETESELREIYTEPRQLAGVTLRDGSSVNLSVDSKIRLSETFNKNTRTIFLDGQAYFDIKHFPNRPFIVKTRNADINVLGTAFSVRAYPDDLNIQVVVESGSVAMSSTLDTNERPVFLEAGELGELDMESGRIRVSRVETKDYLGWLDGRLVFRDTKLIDVGRDLERWFGIEFYIHDEVLKSRRLTAVLDNRSLSNVLDVISIAMEIYYEYDEDNKRVILGL